MDQEWALLRRDAQHADAAGTLVPLSGSRLLRLMAAVEQAEAERDAALERERRLERTIRTAVVCIVDMVGLMEQGARLEPDGLRVISERLGDALAATAKESE